MSGDRRYEAGWKPVEQRVTFRGRIRTNGNGVMDPTTRLPAFGVSIVRTNVGLATATLVEDDGTTAARFVEIEKAEFDIQHDNAAGANEPMKIQTIVINATAGTVTMRCLDSTGAVVEFPVSGANNWLHWDIEAKYTTTAP